MMQLESGDTSNSLSPTAGASDADSRVNDLLDDGSDAFHVIEAHLRLAWQLDQISPHSFSMRETLTDPWFIIRKKMNRNIAPLNFITCAAQDLDETRGQFITAL